MSAQNPTFHLVNAFAPTRHAGNQAAVVIFPTGSDPRSKDTEWMLNVAKDFNLPMTAYLVPLDGAGEADGKIGNYGLRWFSPVHEAPLCGHATLASAYILFSSRPSRETLKLTTRSKGVLVARKVDDGRVQITLPSMTPDERASFTGKPVQEDLDDVIKAFGVDVGDVVTAERFGEGDMQSTIVQFTERIDIGKLQVPDVHLMEKLAARFLLATQISADQPDDHLHINSRVFGAKHTGLEDLVTGSAHALLVGYYLASSATPRILPSRFQAKPLETIVEGHQLSARGGKMTCRWDEGKVHLIGQSWEWANGELTVPL
ncbi:hypothetical protein IAT38_007804 [Cryptococcus sp. DSM 104549]